MCRGRLRKHEIAAEAAGLASPKEAPGGGVQEVVLVLGRTLPWLEDRMNRVVPGRQQ